MAKYEDLVDVPELGRGYRCAPETKAPLLLWKGAVEARGGIFHVNSLTRTVAEQQPFRDAYVLWDAAGRPKKGSEKWTDDMSTVAANEPGQSGHQGGISADVSTVKCFPREPADKQVDLLWETGRASGWTPIIRTPDENENERWHFDHKGSWKPVFDHYGGKVGYLCSALNVGEAGKWQSDARLIQALLLRKGYDVGIPDGIIGARTQKALARVGIATPWNDPAFPWDALRTTAQVPWAPVR